MSGAFTSQSTTAPWDVQVPYLKEAFSGGKQLYEQGTPEYYRGPTVAGFDPYQTEAQEGIRNYAYGGPVAGLQGASLAANLGQMYGQTPFSEGQQAGLLAGDVNYGAGSPFAAMTDVYTNQAMNQLTGKILPGIRESIVNYQPGGGTRPDLIQGTAIAGAQKNLQDQLAQMYSGAYGQAQAQRMPMANMILGQQAQGLGQYPTIMGAPLQMAGAVGDVGAERRAMTQEDINQSMQRYNYEMGLPQQNLQNYLANISGNFGGVSSATPSPMSTIGQLGSLALNLISDVRLKENIRSVGNHRGLGVYQYNYIWSPVQHIGVMAQEVERIMPEAVFEVGGYKGVNYGKIL